MRASPFVALDLPLRLLVWSDHGHTLVSYTKSSELAARYNLSEDQARAFAGIDDLTDVLVAE